MPSHAPELQMLRWLPQGIGARRVRLELRRVDGGTAPVEIGRCLRKAKGEVESGFGIEALRLNAALTEALAPEQIGESLSTALNTSSQTESVTSSGR